MIATFERSAARLPALRDSLLRHLPREAVCEDPRTLARLARTTGTQSTRPCLVVRPTRTAEVQEVVRAAGRHAVPLYPISGGKNWGYGDACAPRDGCILLDLSGMNRILEVNAELAYAVIEPGVTQGQLYNHLCERGLPLVMDAVGAGPESSVLGNILDRGVGLSRYSDRFAQACAFEAVLGDGRLLHTGFGSYEQARAEHVYKPGCGPALDGLLVQGNLGIVTRATIWLMPKPERFEAFFITLDEDAAIGSLVGALRRLRLAGTIRCSVHCFNALRLLGGLERFPWDRADGRRALEDAHPELVGEMLRRQGLPAWVTTGSLTGDRGEVAAARKVLRRSLAGVPGVRLTFLNRRLLGLAGRIASCLPDRGPFRGLRSKVEKLQMWVAFLQGQASYQTLSGSHWRARGNPGPTGDPLDSRSGLLWISPVLPMTAEAVEEVSRIGRTHFHRFGFEFQVTLSMLSDRALCELMSLHFDRDNPEEAARAAACHDQLVKELLERGYVPYRGSPATISQLHRAAPEYWDVARRLKEALDPRDLLAPGRYIPAATRPAEAPAPWLQA